MIKISIKFYTLSSYNRLEVETDTRLKEVVLMGATMWVLFPLVILTKHNIIIEKLFNRSFIALVFVCRHWSIKLSQPYPNFNDVMLFLQYSPPPKDI